MKKETREKISRKLQGKKQTREHIEHNRLAHLGQKAWNKGIAWSEDHKEKLRGRIFTESHKKKISENHADVKDINNPNYGKPRSEEVRQKISATLRARKNKGRDSN